MYDFKFNSILRKYRWPKSRQAAEKRKPVWLTSTCVHAVALLTANTVDQTKRKTHF